MSLDVWLEIDAGGVDFAKISGCDHWNYTHNVNPMWMDLFNKTLGDYLRGKRAGDTTPVLRGAYRHMSENIERYREMNPPNGWGSADGACEALGELVEWSIRYPNATWGVWS